MSVYNCSEIELKSTWNKQYQKHCDDVRAFFKQNKGNFLEFDIEKDLPGKLVEFLSKIADLEIRYWTIKNITQTPMT